MNLEPALFYLTSMWAPKIYDGHDKTFFFVAYEGFRQVNVYNNQPFTLPTAAYRAGNFSTALTGRRLGTDPLGRPIMEGGPGDNFEQRPAHSKAVAQPGSRTVSLTGR